MSKSAQSSSYLPSKMYGKGKLAMISRVLLATSLIFVIAVAMFSWFSRRGEHPNAKTQPPDVTPETEETLRSARALERFHEENRQKVLAKVADSARTDPQYKEGLLKLTEESVMSLRGFSEAQKRQIWMRIKDSQDAVREMGSKP